MADVNLGSAGTPKCLSKTCHRPKASKRGLCLICYSRAKKMVEAGTTTWEEIVGLGLASDDDEADPFTRAFNEAKKEK